MHSVRESNSDGALRSSGPDPCARQTRVVDHPVGRTASTFPAGCFCGTSMISTKPAVKLIKPKKGRTRLLARDVKSFRKPEAQPNTSMANKDPIHRNWVHFLA